MPAIKTHLGLSLLVELPKGLSDFQPGRLSEPCLQIIHQTDALRKKEILSQDFHSERRALVSEMQKATAPSTDIKNQGLQSRKHGSGVRSPDNVRDDCSCIDFWWPSPCELEWRPLIAALSLLACQWKVVLESLLFLSPISNL